MKILLLHNSHRSGSASGDDLVYQKEAGLLERNGHRVIRFNPSNDEFDGRGLAGKVSAALQIPWSFSSAKRIRDIVRGERPDIAHIHNFFPLISPSVYHVLKGEGVPVVQTLHDFRFFCPMAFFMRNGNICEECRDGRFLRSVRYGCFKESKLRSIPGALMLKLHHRLNTFKDKIDGYICLTESQRVLFLNEGFSEEKLFVKPHFIEDTAMAPSDGTGGYAIFIGRLGEEKGLKTLIEASQKLPDVPIKIIGSGPDEAKFRRLAASLSLKNIEFLGYKPHNECMALLRTARFLVMPSICYETFGLTIVEAFCHGKPVIASKLGAMADIVCDNRTGLLFTPRDSAELAQKIRWFWDNAEECRRMGMNARKEYDAKYTPEKNYAMLKDIYSRVIRNKKG